MLRSSWQLRICSLRRPSHCICGRRRWDVSWARFFEPCLYVERIPMPSGSQSMRAYTGGAQKPFCGAGELRKRSCLLAAQNRYWWASNDLPSFSRYLYGRPIRCSEIDICIEVVLDHTQRGEVMPSLRARASRDMRASLIVESVVEAGRPLRVKSRASSTIIQLRISREASS